MGQDKEENKPSPAEDYLEKKKEEDELGATIPTISLMDVALLGGLVLFLVGSGILWYLFPHQSNIIKYKTQYQPSKNIQIQENFIEEFDTTDSDSIQMETANIEEVDENDPEFFDQEKEKFIEQNLKPKIPRLKSIPFSDTRSANLKSSEQGLLAPGPTGPSPEQQRAFEEVQDLTKP